MALIDLGTDLEQLVWEDIQSDGLDSAAPGCSEPAGKSDLIESRPPPGQHSSSPVSSATDLAVSSALLHSAAGDAGSASMAGQVGSAAGEGVGQEDVGPFAAALQGCHQRLDSAPLGGLHPLQPLGSGPLDPNRSLVTYKTRALAAAAGSLRTGAVGSGLRFAAFMARSNSGGLADTLLSEHARATSGLLTGGLGRCDSLPELSLLAPSAVGDLAELVSLRDLDFLSGMPSAVGLPSMSTLFGERPDFGPTAAAAGAQQDPLPAAAVTDSVLRAAAGEAPADAPTWIGSRILGRPASFTANGAAALFSAGDNAPLARPTFCGLGPQEAEAAAPAVSQGLGHGLKPPSLVDYSQMLMAKEPTLPAAAAAPAGAAAALAGQAAAAAAGPFEGMSLPSFSRQLHNPLIPLGMDRQDTFELLIRQVDQELLAQAEIKQYEALEISTMDVPMPPAQAAPAEAAAAVDDSAAEQRAPKRRSVFEGHTVLVPADASAVSAGTPAVLETVGPSFQSWAATSTSSQASGGSAVGLGAGAGPAAAAAGSPFCLPVSTALPGVGGNSAAASESEMGSALGKQEVARYSRLITCKTYLKRLNITQPMAEHLLPLHDLTIPARPRRSSDGGGASEEGDEDATPKRGTYEQLFKEQIIIVDEAGSTFRVQYEGVSCNAQKHLRLTCGWRDFIRQHSVGVGDTIVFERRGEERGVIYVTVVKAGDAPVDVGPQPKKRRVSRKQAVQRL